MSEFQRKRQEIDDEERKEIAHQLCQRAAETIARLHQVKPPDIEEGNGEFRISHRRHVVVLDYSREAQKDYVFARVGEFDDQPFDWRKLTDSNLKDGEFTKFDDWLLRSIGA